MSALDEANAEIARLRGLLIDPGSPPWEDARAVLVAELRKANLDCHADNVVAAHSIAVPSHIALKLIAQAAAYPVITDGYVAAFYEVARALGIGAQTASPKQVWETQMRPKLAALIAGAGDSA